MGGGTPDPSPVPVTQETVVALKQLVDAAEAWYSKLIEQGWYREGEAGSFSGLRSDRWPPEVDLMAAVEKWRTARTESAA